MSVPTFESALPRRDTEVRTRRGWRLLGYGDSAPQISESAVLEMRGLLPFEGFRIGPDGFHADSEGRVSVRLLKHRTLRGHLGLVEVRRSAGPSGEFDVVPDKTSLHAWQALKADLESVWAGLIFDPDGASSLQGRPPSPRELWREIERPVRDIATEPRSALARAEGVVRLDAVRRSGELTQSVLRAAGPTLRFITASASRGDGRDNPVLSQDRATAQRPRPGRGYRITRVVDTHENRLVAETLRRLVFYARRHQEGAEVALRASRVLREEPFASCRPLRGGITTARTGALHDPRYRRVENVLRVLDRPEAHATEGPGEVRLGVKGIVRIYEYWVYLQVLEACRRRYGPPEEPGFSVLGRSTSAGTMRLDLPAGTTVAFPGEVYAAFEPAIRSSGRGWMNLKNVPHPDKTLAQNLITPDVVVFHRGADPALVAFDAKYVGRHFVDRDAIKTHAKYARIRLRGSPVVRNVLVAHPHEGKDDLWAGYGAVPMIPGEPTDIEALLP